MFQYTHEVIINSLTMPDGTERLVRNGGEKGPLTIKRGGEYWKTFIQNQKVYKTAGHVGTFEILTINVAKLVAMFPGESGVPMAPGVYQLSMFVKLLDPHALYEFGYPMYQNFGRHLLIGFEVVPSDTAATIAAKIYEALELAVRKEEFIVGSLDESGETKKVVDFAKNGTVIAIRANHYALRFDTVGISLYDETTCDSCIGEFLPAIDILTNSDAAKNAASVVVPGVEPFATGQWLIENYRFPTYPNVRYAAIGEEERPVPGVVYNEYSFAYESPRPQLGGLSGVGQAMTAVTRHVYFVPESLASNFESAFTDLGVTIVATNEIEVTDVDANTAYTPGGAPVEGSNEGSNESSEEQGNS